MYFIINNQCSSIFLSKSEPDICSLIEKINVITCADSGRVTFSAVKSSSRDCERDRQISFVTNCYLMQMCVANL